jgi:hypothetical protein
VPDLLEYTHFKLHWVQGATSPALRAELIAFWAGQRAIADPFEAWKRSFEAACLVRNGAGEVVGVSTVYSDMVPQMGAAYWFVRAFMRPDSRQLGLISRVLDLTFARLRQAYHGEPHAPVGLIMCVENPKLMRPAPSRALQRRGYLYLGSDGQGRVVRHRLFATPPSVA